MSFHSLYLGSPLSLVLFLTSTPTTRAGCLHFLLIIIFTGFFSTQTLSLVRLFILLFSILANQMPKVRVQQGIKRLETSHVGSSLAFDIFPSLAAE
jgi:hypothetical protein